MNHLIRPHMAFIVSLFISFIIFVATPPNNVAASQIYGYTGQPLVNNLVVSTPKLTDSDFISGFIEVPVKLISLSNQSVNPIDWSFSAGAFTISKTDTALIFEDFFLTSDSQGLITGWSIHVTNEPSGGPFVDMRLSNPVMGPGVADRVLADDDGIFLCCPEFGRFNTTTGAWAAPIPEPSTLLLLGSGLAGLGFFRWRRKGRKNPSIA